MSATVTKIQLVGKIAEMTGREPQVVRDIVQAVLDTVSEMLVEGKRIELRNFGVFVVKKRRPRVGRNPNKPTQIVHIPSTPLPTFKPGRILKQRVKSAGKA